MKKFILCSFATVLAFTFIPNEIKAATISPKTEMPNVIPSKITLLNRLDEIKAMDKSDLTRNEKKELRKEVRTIDKTLHDNYGGVYISVGALIIIILLIVIFL